MTDVSSLLILINTFSFQQNQIDMNRQSDMMAAFEENIIWGFCVLNQNQDSDNSWGPHYVPLHVWLFSDQVDDTLSWVPSFTSVVDRWCILGPFLSQYFAICVLACMWMSLHMYTYVFHLSTQLRIMYQKSSHVAILCHDTQLRIL